MFLRHRRTNTIRLEVSKVHVHHGGAPFTGAHD